ncbi:hypothetical protein GCM10012275_22810 [Longimycelium tulufanense]|uniref:HTH luxR-type domain-containing protein n=1 Tax=Longimycelium tulufanense TaxID=907463 RepID=A0A8J3CC12_9PSEU|nr:hypothetical protein GCM10012275_22810 [Longimycelium tulufanense]
MAWCHGLIEACSRRLELTRVSPSDLDVLTPRETDVLYLFVKGVSNAEVAAHLTLSAATVKTHLDRFMAKLCLSSRAQAVVLAYETGLVTPHRYTQEHDNNGR